MSTATTPRVNGTAPQPSSVPVDSFKDAAPLLRRPFTAQAVKFKVQATWESGGLIVCYIDARLAIERLNHVCPHLWFDAYEPVDGGKRLLCRLTVDGITRLDIGEGYVGKGLYSDALKRAAVKFGVGVSLYAVPQVILNLKDQHLETKKGKTLLTGSGIARCRELYTGWLTMTGIDSFGEPLDHGDVEDSAGDVEADQQTEQAAGAPQDRDLTPEEQQKVLDAFLAAGLKVSDMQTMSVALGHQDVDTLTVSGAFALRGMLDEYLAKQAKS